MRGSICFLACSAALWASSPYAGDMVCATCHRQEAARYSETPMARAMVPASAVELLREHPDLTFREGGYESHIARQGDTVVLTVSDGAETLSATLLWALGRGKAGQTYVFERDGALFESRLSFYREIGGLDLTMGALGSTPHSIEEAAGRRMNTTSSRECLACHSTGGVREGRLHLEDMTPGVGCEGCHGPAQKHVEAVRAGDAAGAKMRSLVRLTAEEMMELCGKCHRTWAEISMNGPRGVNNVRFQPYRLTNSRCYSPADARIRCAACHNPHAPVETRAAAYDAKCTACHSAAARGKTCRVAAANCITCHMPKIDLPGAHAKFTDHEIRIARAGAPYPD